MNDNIIQKYTSNGIILGFSTKNNFVILGSWINTLKYIIRKYTSNGIILDFTTKNNFGLVGSWINTLEVIVILLSFKSNKCIYSRT